MKIKMRHNSVRFVFPNWDVVLFVSLFRGPKDPVVTRVRVERLVREDRRDIEASLVCRVSPDLQ